MLECDVARVVAFELKVGEKEEVERQDIRSVHGPHLAGIAP